MTEMRSRDGNTTDGLTGKESLAAQIVGGIPECRATITYFLKHLKLIQRGIKPKSVRFHVDIISHGGTVYYTKVQYRTRER